MDCTRAQELLSESLDHDPIDPRLLDEARKHCLECAECTQFVRGLALLERAKPPAVPARVHDAVMAAIAAEAAAATHAADGAAAEEAAAASAEPSTREVLPAPSRSRRIEPTRTLTWVAAAAVVVVVNVAGVRGPGLLGEGTQASGVRFFRKDRDLRQMHLLPPTQQVLDAPIIGPSRCRRVPLRQNTQRFMSLTQPLDQQQLLRAGRASPLQGGRQVPAHANGHAQGETTEQRL